MRLVRSRRDRDAAYAVRVRVFHEEQGISLADEFDEHDRTAVHVLATYEGQPVGTARLLVSPSHARIGRMAVLPDYRRRGIGAAIMQHMLRLAQRRGHRRIILHAQVQAVPFYTSLGFKALGEEFLEDGIVHVCMRREIDPGNTRCPDTRRGLP